MKTFFNCLIILFTIQNSLYSQIVAYEKGRIITKDNDTLNVFVEISVTYGKKVSYKNDINGIKNQINIEQIKSLLTPYNQFDNVAIDKKEYLFRLVVAGKFSLLQYVAINSSGPSESLHGGTMTYYSPPTIIYALRTSDKDYILKKNKDKDLILPLLNNCLEIKKNVELKSFDLSDLEEVTKKMNQCN